MNLRYFRRWLAQNKVFVILTAVVIFSVVVFVQNENLGVKSTYYRVFHGYIFKEEDVNLWIKHTYTGCMGNFVGYGHRFAVLTNVTVKKSDRKFYIPCDGRSYADLKYWFLYGKEGTHLNKWMENIVAFTKDKKVRTDLKMKSVGENALADSKITALEKLTLRKRLVIAVQRYEYANFYHTMTDWYNVFLVAKLLNISIDDVSTLLFGSNLNSALDPVWETLFDNIVYSDEISEPITIPKMVWNILGYESPINHLSRQTLPYVTEFKDFFYNRYDVTLRKKLDCDKLSFVFLLRRDYQSHPGNKEGKVSRKIKNENELIDTVKMDYPNALVKGVQFDQLSFKQQLEIVSATDILIAMHGAGLAHVLFLPGHAGVLEFYPLYWLRTPGNVYFRSMARWRGLKYLSWQNINPNNELPDKYTYIPPNILRQNVRKLYRKVCGLPSEFAHY